MLRLEPMSLRDFTASLERGIVRFAEELTGRGIWAPEASVGASRTEFAELLPKGRRTPNRHFDRLFDEAIDRSVGETWYTVRHQGGKTQFWIDWLWVEPEFRRGGYASEALRLLEAKARSLGADRIGLSAWKDNTTALRLYSKHGFAAMNVRMSKALPP